jgi:hypothetical protein
MRFAEPLFLWWARMLEETLTSPKPEQGTAPSDGPNKPTTWALGEGFQRAMRGLDQMRRSHRRPRHQRRR